METQGNDLVRDLVRVKKTCDSGTLWRSGMERLLAGVEYRISTTDMFGEAQAMDLAGGRLWRLHSDVQIICRPRPSPGRRFAPMALVQVEGHSRLTQFGRVQDLKPGSFVLLDSASPLLIDNFEKFEQVYLHFPAATFAQAEFHRAAATPMDADWELDRAFALGVRDMWHAAPKLRPFQHSAALASLISLCTLTTPFKICDEEGQTPIRVTRAMAFIEQHLGESWLNPQSVADAQHVSRRYLDDLFGKCGHRVGRWIWERRLMRAVEELRVYGQMSGAGRKSILQIALDLGFKSPSHFSRVFTARFGMTPRDYRRNLSTRADTELPTDALTRN